MIIRQRAQLGFLFFQPANIWQDKGNKFWKEPVLVSVLLPKQQWETGGHGGRDGQRLIERSGERRRQTDGERNAHIYVSCSIFALRQHCFERAGEDRTHISLQILREAGLRVTRLTLNMRENNLCLPVVQMFTGAPQSNAALSLSIWRRWILLDRVSAWATYFFSSLRLLLVQVKKWTQIWILIDKL